MHEFDLDETYLARGMETAATRIGEIYHVARNRIGSGSVSTPVARYFVWRPGYSEGINPHWRVDCFVRDHDLSGDPAGMSRQLADNLERAGLCEQPIWVSWHRASELGGAPMGDVWEDC